MLGAIMLMTNMLGYVLGKYPQDFQLDDDQRTLILQTTLFFIWLAGGAAIFERLEGWTFANALYYCNVVSRIALSVNHQTTNVWLSPF
jgi:potassium channel subfamily K, other eukaryote